MPEKVTSLNGLKVTSEYWGYTLGAHNVYYVKWNLGGRVATIRPSTHIAHRTGIIQIIPVSKELTPSCHPPAAATPGYSPSRHAQFHSDQHRAITHHKFCCSL